MATKKMSKPTKFVVTVATAYKDIKAMVDYYKATMTNKNDATSAWVTLDEVLALINDNKGANGIRFYYGRHEHTHPVYPDMHTVVLAATQDKVNPDSPTTQNSIDMLDQTLQPEDPAPVIYTGMGDDRIPLCPPHCPPNPIPYI